MPLTEVSALAVSHGLGPCGGVRRAGCVVGGLLVGTVVGAVLGNRAGAASADRARAVHDCPDGDCDFARLTDGVVGALAGGLAGLLVGAVLPGEHWADLEPVPTHLGAAPGAAGRRLRLGAAPVARPDGRAGGAFWLSVAF